MRVGVIEAVSRCGCCVPAANATRAIASARIIVNSGSAGTGPITRSSCESVDAGPTVTRVARPAIAARNDASVPRARSSIDTAASRYSPGSNGAKFERAIGADDGRSKANRGHPGLAPGQLRRRKGDDRSVVGGASVRAARTVPATLFICADIRRTTPVTGPVTRDLQRRVDDVASIPRGADQPMRGAPDTPVGQHVTPRLDVLAREGDAGGRIVGTAVALCLQTWMPSVTSPSAGSSLTTGYRLALRKAAFLIHPTRSALRL